MSEMKIGAYICKGCGLGERLDTGALVTVAKREGKAAVAREHDMLCSEEGVALIRNDIAAEGVNRIAICACSRRAKTEAFQFDGLPVTRGNLREGVIWVRPDTDEARETTEEMAADYVRMACAEAKYSKPAAPSGQQERNPRLLVVGGGVTGMTAALEAAKAGYEAHVVEKAGALGGIAAQLYKRIPGKAPYAPTANDVDALIQAVQSHPRITVHLNARVTRTSGAPGRFAADITTESGQTATENFGAIVQASGFKPHNVDHLTKYARGKTPDVVTQLELEALARQANGGPIKRPSDGREIRSVLFAQCVGQRYSKEGYLAYCSGYCCNASIKQALYFKEQNPGTDTVILYTDLRTPGSAGEDFYRAGQQAGVTFTKGWVHEVMPGNGALTVKLKDMILNEDTEVQADLVVLANGMEPNSGVNIETEKEAEDGSNRQEISVKSILNLDYRQGRDVPQLVHGFTDSHFICFPYETRRSGIYTAGPVRRPMDMAQAREDAMGAALKAIQSLENAALGRAAHPRSGDLSFPTFQREGCTQCKRCTVECPFGAINEDEQRYPQFNESRCRRCGTCMGACPVRVISFENYSVDSVGQQIKAVDMPDQFSEKPRLLVLACENDAYPALDMAAMNRAEYSAYVRVVPVRCLGSVNTIWITDALNAGYDGVVLMGCRKDNDYQCHFVKGSEIAHYRMSKVDDTLKQLGLEKERVATYEVAITDVQRAPQLINDMAETVNKLGLSPLKF